MDFISICFFYLYLYAFMPPFIAYIAIRHNFLKDVEAMDMESVETEVERRRRLLNEVIEEITANGGGLRMDDNLPREALYDRNALH